MIKTILSIFAIVVIASPAHAGNYSLELAKRPIEINGTTVEKITINGAIPGPTLHFTEGEDVEIAVSNLMDVDSSIHWHGLLVPAEMDGVPGINNFDGIAPGKTFTYRFKIRQSGTYWYHSHSLGQEQDGLYGSIVITPKNGERIESDRDYIVLLSELTKESSVQILNNLKMKSDYYNNSRRTVGDFFNDVKNTGFGAAWSDSKAWGGMRMSKTDLSDVGGYNFAINGRNADQNWTGIFKTGDKVRLRFINASSMSIYDVRIPGLKLKVVQADGQDVEPVEVDEFRIGVAETYDVIVEPCADAAYALVAEPIDRSGFALGTLAPREGMRGETPKHRPRAELTMADMGMEMSGMDHDMLDMPGMAGMESGWSSGTPPGSVALKYDDLRSVDAQKETRPPDREIVVHLGGNMERYIWTLNGMKHGEGPPIFLRFGERVRIKYVNETMMAHPLHLHGMFVQLENSQPPGKRPNKHTIIVPPGRAYSVLLTADEMGEWPIHCHLLYHMLSGMMTTVIVSNEDPAEAEASWLKQEHHHVH